MEALTKTLSAAKSLNRQGSSPLAGEQEPARDDAEVLSRMVAQGVKALPRIPNTIIDIQPTTSPSQRFNPRTDGQFERTQWIQDIAECVRKARIPSSMLISPPPNFTTIQSRHPLEDQNTLLVRLERDIAEYQQYNTAIWDIIYPSVRLAGPFMKSDLEDMQIFKVGDLRDGVGLYKWVLDMGSKTDVNSQVDIANRLANWPGLDPDASHGEFVTHSLDLLELWLSASDTSEAAPSAYYVRLLASLPATPAKTHVANIRSFFAEMITKNDPILASPRKLIHILATHGKTLGMPDVRPPQMHKNDGPALLTAQGAADKKRPNFGMNNCSSCNIDACRSADWLKQAADGCKGDKNSECLVFRADDPIAAPPHGIKLGDGDKTMIRVCRSYAKLNPEITSVKTLKFYDMARYKGAPEPNAAQHHQATPMMALPVSLKEFMGNEITDVAEFEKWLASLDGNMAHPAIGTDEPPSRPESAISAADTAEAKAVSDAISLAVDAALAQERERSDEALRTLRESMQTQLDETKSAMPSVPVTDVLAAPQTPLHMMPAGVPNSALARLRAENTTTTDRSVTTRPDSTNAATHVLKGMLQYENVISELRAKRSGILYVILSFLLAAPRKLASLYKTFGVGNVVGIIATSYIIAPHVGPPIAHAARAAVARALRALLARIRRASAATMLTVTSAYLAAGVPAPLGGAVSDYHGDA